MNLVSCNDCGIVLNKDKLSFPEDIHHEDGTIDTKLATWNGNDFVAFVLCPVCDARILKNE